MEDISFYKEIVEIYKTFSDKKANQYLELGWVLLNVESQQSGAHDWHSIFVLGWQKNSGNVSHPEEKFI